MDQKDPHTAQAANQNPQNPPQQTATGSGPNPTDAETTIAPANGSQSSAGASSSQNQSGSQNQTQGQNQAGSQESSQQGTSSATDASTGTSFATSTGTSTASDAGAGTAPASHGSMPQTGYPSAGMPPNFPPQAPGNYPAYPPQMPSGYPGSYTGPAGMGPGIYGDMGGGMPPGMYPLPGGMPQGMGGGMQPGMYPPAGMGPGMYQPPGGMPGAGGMPGGMYPPQSGMSQMPATPEDTTPANFKIGAKFTAPLKVKVPSGHSLKFDEEYFIRLLAGSISLSKDEKKKIVESIPKLKQSQIDELIRIFEEEKEKFAVLSKKHVPQLDKLAQQHYEEWMQLEDEFARSQKSQEDSQKADDIRKQLGI